MLIHCIAAVRPNFIKIAPLYHELKKQSWAETKIIHTGQHYDLSMSDAFFKDLKLPQPDINLGIGSGSHAEQTGSVMIAYERIVKERRPDLIIVAGDVNSTMAAALVGVKLQIPVAHLEAGLRSHDRSMPEEINRIVTDAVADILWTTSPDADENLRHEGIPEKKILRVGNIMIDSLEMLKKTIQKENYYRQMNLKKGGYGLVTLHRPCNVDSRENLQAICEKIINISKHITLVFPVHPRSEKKLLEYDLLGPVLASPGLMIIKPLNYINFMNLVFNARLVITDSGGIQEETTYLGIKCLTLRPNTERPITICQGTNSLCEIDNLEDHTVKALSERRKKKPKPIHLWDGHTAERIVYSIRELLTINKHNKNILPAIKNSEYIQQSTFYYSLNKQNAG